MLCVFASAGTAPPRREQESAGRSLACPLCRGLALCRCAAVIQCQPGAFFCLDNPCLFLREEGNERTTRVRSQTSTHAHPVDCLQMCAMVECLSRRTWLTDQQLRALSDAFSDEVRRCHGGPVGEEPGMC